MKRKICFVLAAMLMISLVFVGCTPATTTTTTGATTTKATTTATTTATTEMPIDEVTFIMRSWHQVEWEGSDLDQYFQETFGLKFNIEVIDLEGYQEKFEIMFSTGNLPDIATWRGVPIPEINRAGDQGMFVDVYQYMDEMPNLKAICDEYYDQLRFITAASGAMYIMTTFINTPPPGFVVKGWGVRSDILDAAGVDYKNVQTYDELYDVLLALKQGNPDQYVIGKRNNTECAGDFMGVNNDPGWWDPENDKWIANYSTQNFKDWLLFWSKAFADGVLHPDYLTNGTSASNEMCFNGTQTGFCWSFYLLNTYTMGRISEDFTWDFMMPPLYNGKAYGRPATPALDPDMGRLINGKLEDSVVRKIMRLSDWLFTIDGWERIALGIEGEEFVVISEDPYKQVSLVETNKDNVPEQYWDKLYKPEDSRIQTLPFGLYGFYNLTPNPTPNGPLEPVADAAYRDAGFYSEPEPSIALTGAELDAYNDLYSTIKDYAEQMIAQMITGQVDIEAEWDNFQAQLAAYQYNLLIDLYNMGAQNFLEITPNYQP